MTTLLHLDASARLGRSGVQPHGSHSRRLSAHFIERWQHLRPGDRIVRRDVGQHPPHVNPGCMMSWPRATPWSTNCWRPT
ncbi:NAD(P)H-dependent oxidoreductase [Billgrantia endophytica]|uniref:NAD(P)H-dependent oxidoreductase n=1 Tax=Billgrantia endophytica TaxID=2033802 RepID=UPI001F0C786A|nr:NAD(P)H-dependent oxidoreductase [Halomonas endophytica]